MARKGKALGSQPPKGDDAFGWRKVPAGRLRLPQHQVVPMHHLGAALDAEDEQDVGGGLAADLLGVDSAS